MRSIIKTIGFRIDDLTCYNSISQITLCFALLNVIKMSKVQEQWFKNK
jgi:hypothetical protein